MTVLLISYDLNGHERPTAYEAVRKTIEANSVSWARPLYSQWFVETNDTPGTWHGRVKAVTDDNDRWFITPVSSVHQGWLNSEIVDWLNKRV